MRKTTLFFLILSTFMASINVAKSQDSSKVKLNIGADLMSKYVWRGTDYGDSPSIQPYISLTCKNFEIGYWGAVSTNSFYKEVDLYAKYTIGKISIIATDYYIPNIATGAASPDNRYFIYDDVKTSHTIEGSVTYKGDEKFPLWVTGGIFVYGNDKRWGCNAHKDTTNQTYHSAYLEAGYTIPFKENSADVFVGFTPKAGAYATDYGIVNIGITGYRKIKISDDFELPIKATVVANPQSSSIFFMFGITL